MTKNFPSSLQMKCQGKCQMSGIPCTNMHFSNFRSCHWRCSMEKGVSKRFAKFSGKYLCQSLIFDKIAGLTPQACNFIKKQTLGQFAKFLRIPFFQNTSGQLLLKFEATQCKYFTSTRVDNPGNAEIFYETFFLNLINFNV